MSYIHAIPTAADILARAKLSRDLIPDFAAARNDYKTTLAAQ